MASKFIACALMLCGLVVCATASWARPFSVDDLLRQQSFGQITLDPTGRYLVIERSGPYESAASFDHGHRNAAAATQLLLSDLAADGAVRPLMLQQSDYSYLVGPWSPDGRRLVVYRLRGIQWELGVAIVPEADVQWLGITPASDANGRSVQWRSPNELMVITRPDDDPPWELRTGWQSAARLPPRWAATAAGIRAVTVIGSGAFREISPSRAPSRILRVDMSRARIETLATGVFVDLEVSPSARFVALLEVGARLQPTADRSPQGLWGTATEQHHLAVLDVETGHIARPCRSCDLLDTLLSWSPATDRLLIFSRDSRAAWTQGEFKLFHARSGTLESLDATHFAPAMRRRPEAIETSWLGEAPIIRGRPASDLEGRLDWWKLSSSPPRNLTAGLPEAPGAMTIREDGLRAVSKGRLWHVDADGAVRLLRPGLVSPVAWRPATGSERLRYVASGTDAPFVLRDDVSQRLILDGRALVNLPLAASETPVVFSRAQQALVVLNAVSAEISKLEIRTSRRPRVAVAIVNADFADIDPPRVLAIHHRGPENQALTSWLYLPPQSVTAAALIVRPYLGDNYRSAPVPRPPVLGLVADVRVLVGKGYAVLLPSLPLQMTAREPLAGIAQRVLDIVDAAAEQAPGAFDPNRLALWGHSYGGYTALGIISQTERFKAAITMNAPTNLVSLYGTFQPSWRVSPEDGVWPSWPAGWAEDSQGRMGAPPWQAPERYRRNSPVFLAGEIDTPVLLFHADQDPIAVTQSEEMFSALHRQNKDAMIVTYWGEGHIISSPGNVRDLYHRAFEFLQQRLDERGAARASEAMQ